MVAKSKSEFSKHCSDKKCDDAVLKTCTRISRRCIEEAKGRAGKVAEKEGRTEEERSPLPEEAVLCRECNGHVHRQVWLLYKTTCMCSWEQGKQWRREGGSYSSSTADQTYSRKQEQGHNWSTSEQVTLHCIHTVRVQTHMHAHTHTCMHVCIRWRDMYICTSPVTQSRRSH